MAKPTHETKTQSSTHEQANHQIARSQISSKGFSHSSFNGGENLKRDKVVRDVGKYGCKVKLVVWGDEIR